MGGRFSSVIAGVDIGDVDGYCSGVSLTRIALGVFCALVAPTAYLQCACGNACAGRVRGEGGEGREGIGLFWLCDLSDGVSDWVILSDQFERVDLGNVDSRSLIFAIFIPGKY